MDVFISSLGGALVGSVVTALATFVALRQQRSATFDALVLRDAIDASASIDLHLHRWARSIQMLHGPLGEPFDDANQENEMLHRRRLLSTIHRLPPNTPVTREICELVASYTDWLATWIHVESPNDEQMRLPWSLQEATNVVLAALPKDMAILRNRLRVND